jgi:hypothetical protein
MGSILQKIKNWFQYSHYWNKKNFENKINKFSEAIKYHNDIYIKVVSDFRSAHMNIIAWMIAFLWFINKDWIATNIDLKYWVILLLIFIWMSVISILFSYYYDSFVLWARIRYMDWYLKDFVKTKQSIENLDFTKEQALEINKKLKEYNPPKYKIASFIVFILYLLTWSILLVWLYFIIKFYIFSI